MKTYYYLDPRILPLLADYIVNAPEGNFFWVEKQAARAFQKENKEKDLDMAEILGILETDPLLQTDPLRPLESWERHHSRQLVTLLQNAHAGMARIPDAQHLVVTRDAGYASVAESSGFKVADLRVLLNLAELATLMGERKKEPKAPAPTRGNVIITFFLGIFASVLANLLWYFRDAIWSQAGLQAVATLLLLFLGAVAFYVRCTFRSGYGALEIIFGLGSFAIAFTGATPEKLNASTILQLVAPLYIIVRGFDNIDQGWKPKWVEGRWERTFPKLGKALPAFGVWIQKLRNSAFKKKS